MKYILVLSSMGLFLWGCSSSKRGQVPSANDLLQIERQAIEREFQNDTSYLSSIMDHTFIELSGDKLKNKHDVLKTIYDHNLDNIKKGVVLDSFRLEEPVVHIYGGSAVVTFIMHTYRKRNGVPFERRTRFYDVWIKRSDGWKAVTWQATPLE